MADDHTQRPFRSNPMPPQDAGGGARGTSGNDPLAELARLIGQNDPFAEYGRQNAAPPPPQQAPRVSSEWADHVAADAGYIPPPPAPPPGAQQAGGYPPPPDLHPAEYAPAAYEHGVPGYTGGEGGYEPESYYPNVPLPEGEDQHFYDDVPPRRRMRVLAIAAVFALAVVGTAGAFGYRAIFGSSAPSGPPPVIKADSKPAKIVPAKKTKDAKNGKLIYDRVAEHGQDEKLVSREEQPVSMNGKPAGVVLPHDQNGMPSGSIQPGLGSGVIGVQPKKVHTIAIRPDGTVMADAAPKGAPPLAAPPASPAPSAFPPPAAPAAPHMAETKPAPHHSAAPSQAPAPRQHHVAAAPRNAPLSLSPNAGGRTAQPMHTARAAQPARAAPAPAASGGYAVQVASRHSKADAEASLQNLKAKFGAQLGGHQTMVRRVDLGAKGVYYRAMVGPFGSSQAAHQMCSRLKAAGGNCFVQRI
ncbi:MAG: SPOR domain-containing protein [Pseudolabrys sp.]